MAAYSQPQDQQYNYNATNFAPDQYHQSEQEQYAYQYDPSAYNQPDYSYGQTEMYQQQDYSGYNYNQQYTDVNQGQDYNAAYNYSGYNDGNYQQQNVYSESAMTNYDGTNAFPNAQAQNDEWSQNPVQNFPSNGSWDQNSSQNSTASGSWKQNSLARDTQSRTWAIPQRGQGNNRPFFNRGGRGSMSRGGRGNFNRGGNAPNIQEPVFRGRGSNRPGFNRQNFNSHRAGHSNNQPMNNPQSEFNTRGNANSSNFRGRMRGNNFNSRMIRGRGSTLSNRGDRLESFRGRNDKGAFGRKREHDKSFNSPGSKDGSSNGRNVRDRVGQMNQPKMSNNEKVKKSEDTGKSEMKTPSRPQDKLLNEIEEKEKMEAMKANKDKEKMDYVESNNEKMETEENFELTEDEQRRLNEALEQENERQEQERQRLLEIARSKIVAPPPKEAPVTQEEIEKEEEMQRKIRESVVLVLPDREVPVVAKENPIEDLKMSIELREIYRQITSMYLCKLCNVTMQSPKMRVCHYNGKNHMKRLRSFVQTNGRSAGFFLDDPKAENEGENKTEVKELPIVEEMEKDPEKFCQICKIQFSQKIQSEQHYNGKNHAKRKRVLEEEKEGLLQCKICNISVSSKEHLLAHIQGSKHSATVRRMAEGDGGHRGGLRGRGRPMDWRGRGRGRGRGFPGRGGFKRRHNSDQNEDDTSDNKKSKSESQTQTEIETQTET